MRRTQVSLVVIAISLLIIGIVSGTILRHAVQIVPVIAAAVLVYRRSTLAAPVAVGVSAFWLAIMVLIWLYLMGVSRIASGTYSATEIGLTMVIGLATLYGSAAAIGQRQRLSRGRWLGLAAIAFATQYGVLVISFTRGIARD